MGNFTMRGGHSPRCVPSMSMVWASDLHGDVFQKPCFPGLRLGYVVSPASLRQDFYRAKQLDDLGCSRNRPDRLSDIPRRADSTDKHLRQSLVELCLRRKTLLDGIALHLGNRVQVAASSGGMHIVIWFRELKWSAFDRVLEQAARQGLGLHPIHPFYERRPPRPGAHAWICGASAGCDPHGDNDSRPHHSRSAPSTCGSLKNAWCGS